MNHNSCHNLLPGELTFNKEPSEYEQKAIDFLQKAGIKFSYKLTDAQRCPLWCDGKHVHGDEYHVTFSRNGRRFSLHFWNSLHDVQNREKPTAYDVLACITKEEPGSFDFFCSMFGYDTDSRKAEKTYIAVSREWLKVQSFFTTEEIEALQEIN